MLAKDNYKKVPIKTTVLLFCGAIGCPFFITMFLVEGFMRSNYSELRYPLSSLAIGNNGWMQSASFIITGLLLIAFAFGLRSKLILLEESVRGIVPLGLVGMGLIGAGICTTDPVYGYPANLPLALSQFTIRGHLHDLFSMFVFVCLPIACFKFRNRFIVTGEKRWATYSMFTGIAMPAAFVITAIGFKQVPGFVNFAGLFQRATIIIGFTWITLLSINQRRGIS